MSEEPHAHELVIIKRHGGHEDAHHGGVWKIAFADFMTAMMAFFLVMWLISANDKTKASIAHYFNPVELVDSTPQPPGLNDSKKTDPSIQSVSQRTVPDANGHDNKADSKADPGAGAAEHAAADAATAAGEGVKDEAELTRDPYAVLAEIANGANKAAPEKVKQPPIEEAQRGAGTQGRKGGEAFRDPFEPLQAGSLESPAAPGGPASPAPAAESAALPAPVPAPPPPPPIAAMPPAPAPAATTAAVPAPAPPSQPAEAPPEEVKEAASAPAAADQKALPMPVLRARIAALGKSADGGGAEAGPKLDVRQTPEGLLISLTDTADFTMFPSASARPAAKMVTLVDSIAALLKAQKGGITVRGFTDSRPFRSDTYDNWRLSTARAHMAHYMLVRGGVPESRIDLIEGYADRRPKNTKDPDAAENRRIEILLRDPAP